MTVCHEIAQSRCEKSMRSREIPSVLEQYVEGVSGELAIRRRIAAANPRLQQKRS
jgi:hypothetical protein